jgi:hypothetical protein
VDDRSRGVYAPLDLSLFRAVANGRLRL